jgi:hypothetical protein
MSLALSPRWRDSQLWLSQRPPHHRPATQEACAGPKDTQRAAARSALSAGRAAVGHGGSAFRWRQSMALLP